MPKTDAVRTRASTRHDSASQRAARLAGVSEWDDRNVRSDCDLWRTARWRILRAYGVDVILSRVPGVMTFEVRRFKLLILSTVVSNKRAIAKSVSPRFTRYVIVRGCACATRLAGSTLSRPAVVVDASATVDDGRDADPEIARDATSVGAAGRLLAASSVVGARGTTSD